MPLRLRETVPSEIGYLPLAQTLTKELLLT